MTTRWYILNEAKTIEKECQKKHISPEQWVKKFARDYHNRHMQEFNLIKDSHDHIYTAIRGR